MEQMRRDDLECGVLGAASLSPQRGEGLRVRDGYAQRAISEIESRDGITPHPGPLPVEGRGRSARGVTALCIAFVLISALTTYARINVVTLPDRDTVQLTIYNSVDLTLVKETRHLTFRRGLN